jgi:hypothetical protein
VFRDLSAQLDVQLRRMKTALDASLPRINAVLRANNQPPIVPRAVENPALKADLVMDDDTDNDQ